MDWSVTCTSLPLPCNINAFCHVWVLAWCLTLLPFAHYIFLPCSLHERCACLLALHTIQWSGAHFTQPKAFQQGKRINFNTAYTYIKFQISSPDILKSISCLCTIVWQSHFGREYKREHRHEAGQLWLSAGESCYRWWKKWKINYRMPGGI